MNNIFIVHHDAVNKKEPLFMDDSISFLNDRDYHTILFSGISFISGQPALVVSCKKEKTKLAQTYYFNL